MEWVCHLLAYLHDFAGDKLYDSEPDHILTEDDSVFFLKLDKENLNEKFIYFSYVMNAPQGSTLTGGLPSDGKVYEFRSFKKDKIGFTKSILLILKEMKQIILLDHQLRILLKLL